jgi:hypothetical protein
MLVANQLRKTISSATIFSLKINFATDHQPWWATLGDHFLGSRQAAMDQISIQLEILVAELGNIQTVEKI